MFMTKLAFSLHLPLMQYQLVKCSTFILRPKFHQLILYASLWLPVLSAVYSAHTCLFLPRLDSYLEKFGIVSKMKIINSRSTQHSSRKGKGNDPSFIDRALPVSYENSFKRQVQMYVPEEVLILFAVWNRNHFGTAKGCMHWTHHTAPH